MRNEKLPSEVKHLSNNKCEEISKGEGFMKEKKSRIIINYILLVIGSLMVGISVGSILLPVKISTGGFSGIATLLYYLFNLPANIGIILINIPAFVITAKVVGIKYGIKSFIGMLCCSLGITIRRKYGEFNGGFYACCIIWWFSIRHRPCFNL